jgi:hypothetical protein
MRFHPKSHPGHRMYRGCQNNVWMVGRYFVTTTYAAIRFFGTLL